MVQWLGLPVWEIKTLLPAIARCCLLLSCHLLLCMSEINLLHHSILNPGETIIFEDYTQQISEMPLKLQCLQASFGQQKEPNSSPQHSTNYHTTNNSEVERIRLSFASSATFT